MNCPFCHIVEGSASAAVVLRRDGVIAFLDARPLFPGHVLVCPDRHVETFTDAPPALLSRLFAATQQIARAVEQALGAEGSFVAINNRVSQSVPHLHIHVVPRRRGDKLRGFFWPRQRYASDDAREAVRRALADALSEGADPKG